MAQRWGPNHTLKILTKSKTRKTMFISSKVFSDANRSNVPPSKLLIANIFNIKSTLLIIVIYSNESILKFIELKYHKNILKKI
jgi:hypothetical protein